MFFRKAKQIRELQEALSQARLEKTNLEAKASIEQNNNTRLIKQLKKQREEAQSLAEKVKRLETFETKTAIELEDYIQEKSTEKNKLTTKIKKATQRFNELSKQVELYSEELEFIDVGLYNPKYKFTTSTYFKEKLNICRNEQKLMIKEEKAVQQPQSFDLNGDPAKGIQFLRRISKQMIFCFNSETREIIDKVKFSNFDKSKEKILKAANRINKFNSDLFMSLSQKFIDLKIDELTLAYEYALKIEEEKEILKAEKKKEKEEKELQKEIKAKRKLIDKDIQHYENIIHELRKKLEAAQEEDKYEIERELVDIQNKQAEKENEKNELDYREANATAGYVYIISNIGSFGKDVIKIGVTRRLDPLDRINELSGASVPFKFDIHALIFSDDAFKLEKELHHFFSEYRVNKINLRKEFFRIPIETVEEKLSEYKNLTFNFHKEAEAIEYKQTLNLESKIN